MNPREFVNTIYLGDRAVKSILMDGWENEIKIKINEISRIRSQSGHWEYYNDENIVDGLIVFTEVESIRFDPPGLIPNEEIEIDEVSPIVSSGRDKYLFKISTTYCDKQSNFHVIMIEIIAGGIHLEDPNKPNVRIID